MRHYLELNPALLDTTSAVLAADIISGAEQALFGPDATAMTIEATDYEYSHPVDNPTHAIYYTVHSFLARFACLETPRTADFDEPFRLAMATRTRQLDAQIAENIPEEALQNLDYAPRGDGVRLALIRPSGETFNLSFGYYTSPEGCSAGAYNIGIGGRERPQLSGFEACLAIASVLKHGRTDQAATEAIQSGELARSEEALEETDPALWAVKSQCLNAKDGSFEVVSSQEAIRRSTPYLYGLYKRVVEAPDFLPALDDTRRRDLEAMEALSA